jgi:hypothetical protein
MRRTNLVVPLSLLVACSQYTIDKPPEDPPPEVPECAFEAPELGTVPTNPLCAVVEEPPGGFEPIVEWSAGRGESCLALPTVGDLDHDGKPEVVTVFTGNIPGRPGDLVVLNGDGTGVKWRKNNDAAYGAAVALGDVDRDGYGEIYIPLTKDNGLLGLTGKYAMAAYDHVGNLLWESEEFTSEDFDYATGVILSDMDHDGTSEIVAGRVILNADGTTRGVGAFGRGSYGIPPIGGNFASESSVPAVVDIDMDGLEEVITGDAWYNADGTVKLRLNRQNDANIGIANLDDDDFPEIVAISYNTVRVVDHDGSVIWGPWELPTANIVSPPAIGDLDGDGSPEIVVAGGNELYALHADGTTMWTDAVQDESGATGASIFDFEGDGIPEVVYIDEIQMIAYDGLTGTRKFYSDEHGSVTLFDYPVVADVDVDDHAEILVCHFGFGRAISVYGDEESTWRPARKVWNQHAYTILNVNDDLTIPAAPDPFWQVHNTWHSGFTPSGVIQQGIDGPVDVSAEFLGWCETDCVGDSVTVFGRLINLADTTMPAGGVTLALYAVAADGTRTLVDTAATTADVPGGTTGGDVSFQVPKDLAIDAVGFEVVADDIGGGVGLWAECAEANNTATTLGALCVEDDR